MMPCESFPPQLEYSFQQKSYSKTMHHPTHDETLTKIFQREIFQKKNIYFQLIFVSLIEMMDILKIVRAWS